MEVLKISSGGSNRGIYQWYRSYLVSKTCMNHDGLLLRHTCTNFGTRHAAVQWHDTALAAYGGHPSTAPALRFNLSYSPSSKSCRHS